MLIVVQTMTVQIGHAPMGTTVRVYLVAVFLFIVVQMKKVRAKKDWCVWTTSASKNDEAEPTPYSTKREYAKQKRRATQQFEIKGKG